MSPVIQRAIFIGIILIAGIIVGTLLRSITFMIRFLLWLIIIGLGLYAITHFTTRIDIPLLQAIGSFIWLYWPYLLIGGVIIAWSLFLSWVIASILWRLAALIIWWWILIWGITSGFFDFLWAEEPILPNCGDNICQSDEQCNTCPYDCGPCFEPRDPPPVRQYGVSCTTPWWSSITDGFGIYAFRNRSDNPSLCDIQLRMCNDGNLWGEYTQPYCIARNEQNIINTTPPTPLPTPPDPFVQPVRGPITWPFDGKGQLIPYQDLQPIIITDIPYQRPSIAENQESMKQHCITPWWEPVTHGQFVKAYRFPEWYNAQPCESELRSCADWLLLWWFLYPACNPIDAYAEAQARSEKVFYDPIPEGWRNIINNLNSKGVNLFID